LLLHREIAPIFITGSKVFLPYNILISQETVIFKAQSDYKMAIQASETLDCKSNPLSTL